MDAAGLRVPLLIGGAATSATHTAVRLAPLYAGPVVHVPDASRGPVLLGPLLREEQGEAAAATLREAQASLRAQHGGAGVRSIGLATARTRRVPAQAPAAPPPWLGVREVSWDVAELVPEIHWPALLRAWDLQRAHVGGDAARGAAAASLRDDAQALLARLIADDALEARGLYGFFAARGVDEDIEVYADATRAQVVQTLHTVRVQRDEAVTPALADFVAPAGDHVGAFVLSTGWGVAALRQQAEAAGDVYQALLVGCLADVLVEAFSEVLHRRVSTLWGAEDVSGERHVIRPAIGYPVYPDHREKEKVLALLGAEMMGFELTSSGMIQPAASVCGLYLAHPEGRYFSALPVGADQVSSYARRAGLTWAEAARRLGHG